MVGGGLHKHPNFMLLFRRTGVWVMSIRLSMGCGGAAEEGKGRPWFQIRVFRTRTLRTRILQRKGPQYADGMYVAWNSLDTY